ncbi:MAG TPA: hypothetical protein VFT64_07205 [Rickettsiales bacterium]|nr:hypothetical protein [Rickettsiales bacterium]
MAENIQEVSGYIGDEPGQTIVPAKALLRPRSFRPAPVRRSVQPQKPRIREVQIQD